MAKNKKKNKNKGRDKPQVNEIRFPHNTLEFPYKRQSPLTKENKEYESIEDITNELYALVETFTDSKFT